MMHAERGINKRLRSAPLSCSGADLSALSVEGPSEMLKAEEDARQVLKGLAESERMLRR